MASSKTWKGPVFGSQSVRFSGNGLHPNLLTTGRMPYDIRSAAVFTLNIISLKSLQSCISIIRMLDPGHII